MPSPRNAFSLSYQDINAAINGGLDTNGTNWSAAQDGDVVNLPAGSSPTWTATQQLIINKNISLVGTSGINPGRTAFVDGSTITGSGQKMISWNTTASNSTATLKGLTIKNEITGSYCIEIAGKTRFNGVDGGFRITEVKFKALTNAGSNQKMWIFVHDWVTGVVDHCFSDCFADIKAPGFLEMDTPSQPGFLGSTTAISGGSNVSIGNFSTSTTPPGVNWTAHGMLTGQGVMFSGTLPGNITTNTVYFVVDPVTINAFNISLTPFGSPITPASTGSGVVGFKCNNVPRRGFYSYSYPWDWGNDFSGVYVEDCIIQNSGFGILQADGPPQDQAGGARCVVRHCSNWCGFDAHGYDESGGNTGMGANESYNNFWYAPVPSASPALHNIRAGSIVAFNEMIIAYQQNNKLGYSTCNRLVGQNGNTMVGPADGTNFFDRNARGGLVDIQTSLPTSQTYTPYETTSTGSQTLGGSTLNVTSTTNFPSSGNIYVNTTANGTQPVAYTNKTSNSFTGCSGGTGSVPANSVVVGPLVIQYTPSGGGASLPNSTYAPVVFQADGTSPGVPNDTRIGAVYAKGTGGSGTASPSYTLPNFGSGDPTNRWAGFTIRNRTKAAGAESDGAQIEPPGLGSVSICHMIVTSSVSGTITTVNVQSPHDPVNETLVTTDNWEMRYIISGIGFPGTATNLPLCNGGQPRMSFFQTAAVMVNGASTQVNKYWHGAAPAGIYYWNCKFAPTTALTGIVDADFQSNQGLGDGSVPRLVGGGINKSVRPGFPMPTNTVTSLRIGADWDTGTFGGTKSGGTNITTLRSTINAADTSWPAAFRATQAYGSTYPHPLTVVPGGAPTINSSTVATGQVGVAFTYQIHATNSPTSYNATGLPGGLSVNTATGLITGAPTTAATTSVTISATNGTGTGSATLTLTVNPATPVITSAGTSSGQVGVSFSYQITASNSPTSFGATGLPAGLSVNTSTGLINGSPTVSGTISVSIKATNAGGTGTKILTLTITPAAPVITSATSATGAVGTAFSYQIMATNGPTSYNASGLPGGLTVNTSTGLISGTPTTSGSSSVTLSATNAGGTGNATLSLIINSTAAPVITSSLTATGTVGGAFSYQITATNSPTSFNATPLPSGLTVNTSTGIISGNPTAPGASNITISATNAGGTGPAVLALTVTDTTAPTVAITAPTAGAVSGVVTIIASASDNVAVAGVQFKVNGVNLTPEITSSPYQVLWDTTLLAPASYNLTAVARDTSGNSTTSATVTVTVADQSPPTVSITSPVDGGYVSGTVLVIASATDNVGVAGVQFKLDGSNLNAEVTPSPFQTSWVTTSLINGIHTLSAVARDAAGNTTTSAVISVHVNNDLTPPLITGVTAINVTTTTATIAWTTDELSDSQVDYGTTSSYGTSTTLDPTLVTSHSVNLTGLTDATTYHFRVDSRDAAGNLAQSTDFTFMTGVLDTTPPIVTITAPTAATVVSGTWIITADASDDVGVAGVQFIVSTGHNVGPEITAAPYSVSWNTTLFTDGAHDITAVARDTSGNIATSSPVTVTVSNGPRGQGRKKRLLG